MDTQITVDVLVNDLDLNFIDQIFESKQFGWLNITISKTVTDIANIIISIKYELVRVGKWHMYI